MKIPPQPIPLALLLLTILAWLPTAGAAERLALVIGNSDYTRLNDLPNAANDASEVAKRLKELGFTLVGADGRDTREAVGNLDDSRLFTAVRDFAGRAAGAEIALIYYAGHGMQIEGEPYLLPTNVPSNDLDLLRRDALALEDVLRRLDGQAALTVAIFDACREIPALEAAVTRATRASGYGASAYRGLSRVQSRGRSRIVAYSGAAGQLVADGVGRQHSPYTEMLLDALTTGEPVEALLQRVAWRFGERHGGQHPEVVIQGVQPGRFFLAGSGPAAGPTGVTTGTPSIPRPEMVRIQGGCFQMGSPESESIRDSDEGRHRVCVEGFELGAKEVTVGEFRRFVEATGYRTDAERDAGGEDGCRAYDRDDEQAKWASRSWSDWRSPNQYQPNQADHPVACVSWKDAVAYIEWLKGELGSGWRLPTEAEWEYAARAGTTGRRYWGEDEGAACGNANVADEAHGWSQSFPCDDGQKWSAPVGSYGPNPWGLHDMLGNVWEWTCSKYDSGYGGEEKRCVGTADVGSARSLRGGSWNNYPWNVRAAYRNRYHPENRLDFLGFRLARTITP